MDGTPLAERLRPHSLDEVIGQKHLVGPNASLRKSMEHGFIPSMILWGPPGVGKTTLARIMAETAGRPFKQLSAISSGVKEVRAVIQEAKSKGSLLLFIDEIHRFNKSQQDALLGAVEKGLLVLIGATTENPSFEVNRALLSRCQVYILESLSKEDLESLIERALHEDVLLSKKAIELPSTESLISLSGGDARKLLNLLEMAVLQAEGDRIILTEELLQKVAQQNLAQYDKGGEMHYDIISAFIKSVRGSEPNAALYYLACMLKGGEDLRFIARRLAILAAEDIGLANPNALLLANAVFELVDKIGMPEARIPLSELTIYLASSPKSNSAYLAIDAALAEVDKHGVQAPPLHLRNAPTELMKKAGYGKAYKYPHDYPGHFTAQNYFPESLRKRDFFHPADNSREAQLMEQLKHWWKREGTTKD